MSKTTRLSKSRLMAHLQCPKRLWLQTHCTELLQEGGPTTAMAEGHRVGEVARNLYPDGILIESGDLTQDLADTQRWLQTAPEKPLFEATLAAGGLLVKVDLLLPVDGGYRMVEVKSSTGPKPHQVLDASIQAWVLQQAGVSLKGVALACIDNQFVYAGGGDYKGLFRLHDLDQAARDHAAAMPDWIAAAQATVAGLEPVVEMGLQCNAPHPCPFATHCTSLNTATGQTEIEFPVELLPRHMGLAQALREEGYADLRDVPLERLDRESHRRIWRITQEGQPEVLSQARQFSRSLPYPRYYLDFETIAFAVPRWANTRPYQQVPFQFSCHIECVPGSLMPNAYLSGDGSDPRREFALALIRATSGTAYTDAGLDIDPTGPVLVYSAGFERGRIEDLAQHFPDLATPLLAINERMVDLLPITRQNYYHPDMHGSWSLKAVVPTLGMDLAYEGMAVADGGMAQEAYLELIDPDTADDRRHELRQDLLDYCALDTYALVRLVEFFRGET